jgi:uroporphyrinogen-III synthase
VPDAVLTRDPEGAAPYAAALSSLGLSVIAMPVTRTDPASDEDRAKLAAAMAHIDRYDALLVASPRAAESVVAATGGDLTLLWKANTKVWAIGQATQAALGRAGITAAVPAKADAAGLAEAVIAAGGAKSILLPRAEGGRDEGVAALEAAGATVESITAYRTVAVDAADKAIADGLVALSKDKAALLALFAPSQVTALDAILVERKLQLAALKCPIVAIGATTAAAIEAAGATVGATAAAPTPEGMAKAASAVYR